VPRVNAGSSTARPKAEEESFGERLKKAVEKKSGKKAHEEYVKRENERLEEQRRRLRPRPRTKGE
jgi:hypothetical protein